MQFIKYLGVYYQKKYVKIRKILDFYVKIISYLLQMNNLDFLYNCNVLLVQFLLGLTGIDLKTTSDKEQCAFACVIESIYHLRN